jgi:hypothetical protein
MFWNNNREVYSKALYYIELYADPIRMAMNDLERGEIKDVTILSVISQIMVDESSHNLDREVSY